MTLGGSKHSRSFNDQNPARASILHATTAILLVVSLGCFVGSTDKVFAQTAVESKTAAAAFQFLQAQARGGAIFTFASKPEMLRALIEGQGLLQENASAGGGIWSRKDATGFVWIRVASPELLIKNKDHVEVAFVQPGRLPMPQALLTHLLSKSEKTVISGADLFDIEMSLELVLNGKCGTSTTLTVDLTGALVSTHISTFCDR